MSEISREYGGALYELAADENLTDELLEETGEVGEILRGNPDYIRLLTSPDVPEEERDAAICRAFSTAQLYLRNFLRMAVKLGYAREIPACMEEYRRLYNVRHGIAEALVSSAVALTPEQKQKLTAALEQHCGVKIAPVYRVDASLLGGIRVEAAGTLLDGTVRHKLDGIRDTLRQMTI